MGVYKMLELLQAKDKGYIILVNIGSFYIAAGKDAVLLHNILNLKASCMEPEICKVGFPINSISKYAKLIEEKNYSYVIYNYDNQEEKLKIIKKYQGTYFNNIEVNKLNCYICTNKVKMYKKHDKYIQAVSNLYEEENQKENKNKIGNTNRKRKIKWTRKRKKKINYN